eukprot:7456776-Pyramimonas_sp.AAC.1
MLLTTAPSYHNSGGVVRAALRAPLDAPAALAAAWRLLLCCTRDLQQYASNDDTIAARHNKIILQL